MADPTGKVKPGDGLNRLFQAATFNLTMDTVNDYLRRVRGRTGAAGNAPDPIVPATLIYVKNATGSTLLPYSVVTPNGTPIYDPADEPVGQQQQPLIEVIAPASDSDVVLITQEEIADGEIGLAASAGVCVAAVAVSSGTHKFAAPSAGVTTSLTSGTSGPVRILEPWSSGTGERLVLIGSQAAVGGSVTAEEADGSPSYGSVTTLRFDQADGFVLTNPSAGVARIDMAAATASQAGIVSTSSQTFGGNKSMPNGMSVTTFALVPAGTAITIATVLAAQIAPTTQSVPDGTSEAVMWIGSSGGTLRGHLTASEVVDSTHGADVWIVPHGNFTGTAYTGRLIVPGRYAMWDPGDGKTYTGADGTFTTADAKTVTVKGGIITSIV